MNSVCITGRLTADPELRHTPSGKAVTSITVAVDDPYKNADGSHKTYFIDCVAWERTAEVMQRFFHKGNMVGIEGMLTTRAWQDKQGNNRKSTEIVIRQITFLQSKKKEDDYPEANDEDFDIIDNSEDLPFD